MHIYSVYILCVCVCVCVCVCALLFLSNKCSTYAEQINEN